MRNDDDLSHRCPHAAFMPAEKEPIPSIVFLDEARRLVEEAEKQGILLRIVGGVAFRIHCPEYAGLYTKLRRLETTEFLDVDFVSLSKRSSKLPNFFKSAGFNKPKMGAGLLVQATTVSRQMYEGPKFKVDVFLDKMVMCHTIDFRDRIELDKPTVPLADLLLTKMQIVEINLKDAKDAVVLLREHRIGRSDTETIDVKYIAGLLSKDWGLYYTCQNNLKKLRDHFLPALPALDANDRADVEKKIEDIIGRVDEEPKSLGWRVRSKVGTRQKWYSEPSAIT